MNRLLKGKDRWGDCGILPGWRSVLNLNFECWARRSHPCTGTHLHPEAFIYIHTHTHTHPVFTPPQYLFVSFCWKEIFLWKLISMWAQMEGKEDERLILCKFPDNRRPVSLFALPEKSPVVRKIHSEISWGHFRDQLRVFQWSWGKSVWSFEDSFAGCCSYLT